jgi:hypothetical protein
LITLSAIVLVGVALVSTPAEARPATNYESWTTAAAPIYWCTTPSISTCITPMNGVGAGARLHMICWEDETTGRWFWVDFGGLVGFIKSTLVAGQISTPNCWWKSDTTTGNWAFQHLGQTYASSAEANLVPWAWTPGSFGEWSGDCVAFAWLATHSGSLSMWVGGNAINIFNYYKANGRVHTGGVPPRGALVFWHAYNSAGVDYGHVAVSAGNGWVVGTQGWDGQGLPIALSTITSHGTPLGWVFLTEWQG